MDNFYLFVPQLSSGISGGRGGTNPWWVAKLDMPVPLPPRFESLIAVGAEKWAHTRVTSYVGLETHRVEKTSPTNLRTSTILETKMKFPT